MLVNRFQCFAVLLSEILICESTGFDFAIQIICLLDIAGKDGHSLEVETETLRKEFLHANHVSRKVVLRIRVAGGCHLREIDDCDLFIIVDQQVEFVEITVNQTMLCQFDDLLKQVFVNFLRIAKLFNVCHGVALDVRHHYCVAVGVDGDRSWEPLIVKSLHECELLQ